MTHLITCPTCQRRIEWSTENKWRPFCSERCKLIDLGAWAAEKHTIPVDSSNDNLEHNPGDSADE